MVAHWRGYDKQHANSTSPLLVGAQGTRKSTFCRDLIPPELRGYYTDSIDFGPQAGCRDVFESLCADQY